MTVSRPDDWFVSSTQHPDATVTVAAFPPVGGGCSAFAHHAKNMPEWLELMTLNLPGRQARFREPLRTDIEELTAELSAYWENNPSPFVFFGYCSGALLAYCVAHDMWNRGAAMPRHLIVGSHRAPHRPSIGSLNDLDSEDLWEFLAEHQALSPSLIANPELRQLSEPILRGDLRLMAGYRHVPSPPLPVPITVLVGDRDPLTSAEDISDWAHHTSRCFEVQRLPAGHWFMEEDEVASTEALVAVVEATLSR